MAEKRDTGQGMVVGGVGGTLLGALIATLLAAKPAEAAAPDEKLDYLIECQTALVQASARVIELLELLVAATGIPPAEGVEIAIKTPWVAKEPEQIYSYAIRTAPATFYSDRMVDWTEGKRILIKVESSLNQDCIIQVIGNFVDDMPLASDIGDPEDCPANGNISIGLAWDDWMPFIGVRITTVAPAPTAGILNIWAVIQE